MFSSNLRVFGWYFFKYSSHPSLSPLPLGLPTVTRLTVSHGSLKLCSFSILLSALQTWYFIYFQIHWFGGGGPYSNLLLKPTSQFYISITVLFHSIVYFLLNFFKFLLLFSIWWYIILLISFSSEHVWDISLKSLMITSNVSTS